MRGKYEQPKSKGRGVLVAVLIILIVLMIGLLAVVLYGSHLLGLINYSDDGYDADQAYLEDAGLDVVRDKDVLNILLIGQDARPGETQTRSDTMILCSYHKGRKELTLTSFMRDMYVQIPGYKDNRINASYAFGGMQLLNKCLNKNFGVQIDGNVEVDFTGFQTVIDTLGGLDIELTAAEAQYLNRRGNWDIEDNAGQWSLKAGVNRLNGSQAVAFSRIRNVGNGDFGRTNRQRVLLSTLLERMTTMSALEVKDLLDEILPLLTTDLSNAEIMGYAMELFPLLTSLEITTQQIPADGAYRMASIDGMSVLLPDLKKNVAILEEIMKD